MPRTTRASGQASGRRSPGEPDLPPVTRIAQTVSAVGQFKVTLTLYPQGAGEPRTVEALVDSGAAYSVAPRTLLEALGGRPVRPQRVILAAGRSEEWPLTQLDVECQGRRATTPVLMGPADRPVLLGATTLEELGLGIDPLNRRLIPVDVYLA
jgi:clan AA aspartic protease